MALRVVVNTKQAQKATVDLRRDLQNLGHAAVDNEKDFKKLENRMQKGLKADTASKSTENLRKSLKLTRLETAGLQREMGDYSGALKTLTLGSGAAAKNLSTLAMAAGAAFAYFGVQQLKDIVNIGMAFESLNLAFKAVEGSSTGAITQLRFMKSISKDLGLSLNTLESSYKGILAASKGTKLEGKPLEKIFLAVSKASAVLGLSVDDTSGILRAFQQMISKSTIQAEELRGQVAERLPGALNIAAEAMGMTTHELAKMMEQGKLMADDLLPKMADVLEKRFGAAAKGVPDTARFAFVSLTNAVLSFKRTLADAGLTEFFADVARTATKTIEVLDSLMMNQESLGVRLKAVRENITSVGAKSEIEDLIKQYDILFERMIKSGKGSIYKEDFKKQMAEYSKLKDAMHEVEDLKDLNIEITGWEKFAEINEKLAVATSSYDKLIASQIKQYETMNIATTAIDNYEKGISTGDATMADAIKTSKKWVEQLEAQAKFDKTAVESSRDIGVSQALDLWFIDIEELETQLHEGVSAESIAAETTAEIWKKAHQETYAIRKKLSEVSYDEISSIDRALALEAIKIEKDKWDILSSFQDDYKQATMSTTAYELDQLDKRYEHYDEFIDDKEKLDQWYAAQSKAIIEENSIDWSNAFDGFANDWATSLNDMLWGAEVTFGDIFVSFGKMITQMVIQQQALKAMDWGSSFNWGSLVSGVSSVFGGGAAAGSYTGGQTVSMAGGGVINEHVVGMGLSSGKSYEFGEGGVPEAVISKNDWSGNNSVKNSISITNNISVESTGNQEDDNNMAELIAETINFKVKDTIRNEMRVGGMLNNSINGNIR